MKRYLLVEADELIADTLLADLSAYPGVGDIDEHGGGCCCKNCPWKGDHGWHPDASPVEGE